MCRDGSGAADDQRGACLVDQNRVHLIDNRINMPALDLLLFRRSHAVVSQVVEAKLRVHSIRDIAMILRAAEGRVLVVLNDTGSETKEAIDLAHGFAVTASEVIVRCDEMRAAA